jgi:NAD(P)H-nitrite reductase large subunit
VRIVIIGNSTAAVGAIEGIRAADSAANIAVISAEMVHTYSRPLISYLLEGKTDIDRMKYRPADFYERNNVQTFFGCTVTAVDAVARAVVLDNGEHIGYDKLLLAAGSRPFVPPIEGLCGTEHYTFQSLADAKSLEAALTPKSRVLIIGAGLIGLKCAEGIHSRVGNIAVAEFAPRILPSILDGGGAALVQSHLVGKGLTFHLGNAVASVDGHTAALADGAQVPYDVLVVASGVKPNIELLTAIGAKAGRALITDSCGRTSLPDIFAAGDCAESIDLTDGRRRVLAILPNAYLQGRAAGKAMAGLEEPFTEAMPVNSIGLFGLHIGTAGAMRCEPETDNNPQYSDVNNYRRFFFSDNRLTGFILIGDVNRAGIYTALVRAKVPIDTINFAAIAEKPQLMAFSPAARKQMLNGEKNDS